MLDSLEIMTIMGFTKRVAEPQHNERRTADVKTFARLRGEIRGTFGTQEAFAQAMGITLPKLSRLLNGRQDWTRDDILAAAQALRIPTSRIHEYFF